MKESFWRTEVWHPLTVHFPIALLIFSTLLFFASLILPVNKIKWQKFSFVTLIAGTLAAWVALYTGNLADGVVARKICDPLILKDHEIAAQTSTYIFTAASIVSVMFFVPSVGATLRKVAVGLVGACMVAGSIYLTLASHAGATLVYDQGAGVRNHSVDCN